MNPQKYVIFKYAINKKHDIKIIFMTSSIRENNKNISFSNTQLVKKNMMSRFCIIY